MADRDPEPTTLPGGPGASPREQRLASGGVVRRKRLKRLLAVAQLQAARDSAQHAEAVGEALGVLRAIIGSPDLSSRDGKVRDRAVRESRLAAAALLQHYRQLGSVAEAERQGDQHLHLHEGGGMNREAYRAALKDPETREAAEKMLEFIAKRDAEQA